MSGFILQTPHVESETGWQFEVFENSFTMDHPVCGNISLWYQTSVLYLFPLDLPAEFEFNFVFGASVLPTPDRFSMLQTTGKV